jgi:hypothetical protein
MIVADRSNQALRDDLTRWVFKKFMLQPGESQSRLLYAVPPKQPGWILEVRYAIGSVQRTFRLSP